MAFWDRITALVAGGAVARAASDGAAPVLEPVRQHAWTRNQLRVLDPGTAAELVAQAIVDLPTAEVEASRNGIGPERMHALYLLAQTVPGIGELLRALDRKTITPEQFNHALAKHKIDPAYWEALADLANDKLDPVQLANAIHRGLVPDPGLLAVEPPSGQGNVPAYPVYDVPAVKEAQAAGLDRTRLGVLVGLMGLPMGVHEAAQAVFRKILTRTDFDRAVAEGNTRNEWGDAIFEQSRQIPTAREFLENALRGYRTLAEALKGAELHGMSLEHATMIYQNQGRPMAVRQITQALARGGTFKPEPGEITDPFRAAIVEGNLKPAYYDLAYANRYTLPSAFVLRALVQTGDLSQVEGKQLLEDIGWPPDLALKVSVKWAGGAGSAGAQQTKAELLAEYAGGFITPEEFRAVLVSLGFEGTALEREIHLGDARRNASLRERIVRAIEKGYIDHKIDATAATAELAEVNVLGDAATMLISLWDKERRFRVSDLTPAQIAKAAKVKALTPEAAKAELLERGYSDADATTMLAIA